MIELNTQDIKLLVWSVIGAGVIEGIKYLLTHNFSIITTGLFILIIFETSILFRHSKARKQVGISKLFPAGVKQPDINERLLNLRAHFEFWGISGRIFFDSDLEKYLTDITKKNISYRFLLLDPNSPHLKRKAEEEGDDPQAWQQDIRATIQRLSAIKRKYGVNIEVQTYDFYPTIWMINIDEATLYLQFFPTGKKGTRSPLLILRNTESSFFEAFSREFQETWEYKSHPVSL